VERSSGLTKTQSFDEKAEQAKTLGCQLCRERHGFESDSVDAPKAPQIVLDPLDERRVGRGIDRDGGTVESGEDNRAGVGLVAHRHDWPGSAAPAFPGGQHRRSLGP
jgi:hypothetical protein